MTSAFDGPVTVMFSSIGPEISVSPRREAEDRQDLENWLGIDIVAVQVEIDPRRGPEVAYATLHGKSQILDFQAVILELEQRLFFLVIELAFEHDSF